MSGGSDGGIDHIDIRVTYRFFGRSRRVLWKICRSVGRRDQWRFIFVSTFVGHEYSSRYGRSTDWCIFLQLTLGIPVEMEFLSRSGYGNRARATLTTFTVHLTTSWFGSLSGKEEKCSTNGMTMEEKPGKTNRGSRSHVEGTGARYPCRLMMVSGSKAPVAWDGAGCFSDGRTKLTCA